jgi:uncharacterized protein
MPRPLVNLRRGAVTLDTGRRSVDVPVDGSGHLRRLARLDQSTVTRSVEQGQPIGFKGHAAVFNKRSWIGGKRWGFWEEMAPGCFTKTIGEADVRMLQNHDPNLLLARNKAGTLRLAEDEVGLAVDADMAPVSYAQDLAILLEREDCNQMSFAFEMISYEWRELEDGSELLRHTEVGLWDVSPVTYPAYVETDASLRCDLLAAARSGGLDALDLDRLGEMLADPAPDLIASLRTLVRSERRAPEQATEKRAVRTDLMLLSEHRPAGLPAS